MQVDAKMERSKKQRPPSPPLIISDRKTMKNYQTGSFLGQGGFARCYLVTYDDEIYAAKVVHKKSLKSKKQTQKVMGFKSVII
jgi:hypothetical protein